MTLLRCARLIVTVDISGVEPAPRPVTPSCLMPLVNKILPLDSNQHRHKDHSECSPHQTRDGIEPLSGLLQGLVRGPSWSRTNICRL